MFYVILCLFEYGGVQHMLCALSFCFVFLRLLYPMLPVSLDCPFLIASSVFSSIYLDQLFKMCYIIFPLAFCEIKDRHYFMIVNNSNKVVRKV